jgi:hypothetical protein
MGQGPIAILARVYPGEQQEYIDGYNRKNQK